MFVLEQVTTGEEGFFAAGDPAANFSNPVRSLGGSTWSGLTGQDFRNNHVRPFCLPWPSPAGLCCFSKNSLQELLSQFVAMQMLVCPMRLQAAAFLRHAVSGFCEHASFWRHLLQTEPMLLWPSSGLRRAVQCHAAILQSCSPLCCLTSSGMFWYKVLQMPVIMGAAAVSLACHHCCKNWTAADLLSAC